MSDDISPPIEEVLTRVREWLLREAKRMHARRPFAAIDTAELTLRLLDPCFDGDDAPAIVVAFEERSQPEEQCVRLPKGTVE